jgi:signal transduction histidine kinase
MRPYSLTRRLISTVLLLELALALCTTAATLLYEQRQRLRSFDVMLRGRADSLLGAVRDAEDAGDNVMLYPNAIDLQRDDLWEVREPSGRVVAHSSTWNPSVEPAIEASGRSNDFRSGGRSYRGLAIHGIRQIDLAEDNPGIARPVIIFYAAPLYPVSHGMREVARFLLVANSLLLLLTGAVLFVLIRRGLRPLQELSVAAAAITPQRWQFQAPASASSVKELNVLATALDSAMIRLEQSLRQQQAFVHDAAHELKTAVTIIKSSLQLLASRHRTAEQYALGLETCLADCGRMEELVQRMLTLARFEQPSSKSGGSAESTDLSARVREVGMQMETFAELGRVRFVLEISGPAAVRLSVEACDTLLTNLILNALQHTPEHGVVRVRMNANDKIVTLEVEDTGSGIGPDELAHLFERFYRGDPSRSRRTGGTGLGLAICKAITESCGGSIEIHSERGSGTSAIVKLPSLSSSGILQESHLDSLRNAESKSLISGSKA